MDARQKFIELAQRKESTEEELRNAVIDMICEDVEFLFKAPPRPWLPEIKKP